MDRIFYKADVEDPVTHLPIYIFDTSFLPPTDVIDYDAFIVTLMSHLPMERYTLLMFSCGLNRISWMWGLKFLKSFLGPNDSEHLERIERIITVHDSWFIKTITQILRNYNTTRKNFSSLNRIIESFNNKQKRIGNLRSFSQAINNCSTLSKLASCLDITRLKISLNVYKYDLQLENAIDISHETELINENTKIDSQTDPLFFSHFYQIFSIIDSYATRSELVFHRPGNKVNTEILFNCVNRNQVIWINDWDLYTIATTFKKILMELPDPFIPIEKIHLPMKDDLKSTKRNFEAIVQSYQRSSNYAQVSVQIFDLCYKLILNTHITRHSSSTLSKCLSHCLSHEIILLQNKDSILIVNRFLKNIMDHWPSMRTSYVSKYPTIKDALNYPEESADIKNSYDCGRDWSVISCEEEEQEFDTSNILDSRSLKYDPFMSSSVSSAGSSDVGLKLSTFSSKEVKAQPSLTKNTKVIKESNKLEEGKCIDSSKPLEKDKLADISNVALQYPPQKYKFSVDKNRSPKREPSTRVVSPLSATKKPVIRGRKVGEIARLFEERAEGFEILNGMK